MSELDDVEEDIEDQRTSPKVHEVDLPLTMMLEENKNSQIVVNTFGSLEIVIRVLSPRVILKLIMRSYPSNQFLRFKTLKNLCLKW